MLIDLLPYPVDGLPVPPAAMLSCLPFLYLEDCHCNAVDGMASDVRKGYVVFTEIQLNNHENRVHSLVRNGLYCLLLAPSWLLQASH